MGHRSLALLALILFTLQPANAFAGQDCIDGIDCYCDCVDGPADGGGVYKNAACAAKVVPVDTLAVICEDFEAAVLHDNVGVGNGYPNFGPWYDNSGFTGWRGKNSYWTHVYGPPTPACSWPHLQPTNPTLGVTCDVPNNNGPCDTAEWSAGDPWNGNNWACVDIVRNGEFDDERASLQPLTFPASMGGSGVFDGSSSIAHRTPQGGGRTAGKHGHADFGRSISTIGVTQAIAYPADFLASGVIGSGPNYIGPFKFNEFGANGASEEGWYNGNTGQGGIDEFPYRPFARYGNCAAATTNAVALVGAFGCNGPGLKIGSTTAYSQPVDFPFGQWGCTQAYMEGMNTTNMAIKVWHNNVLIIHIVGINGTALGVQSYDGFAWNNYTNANEGGNGTDYVTYRYEDNMHVREGEPVSCEQIGFDFSPAPDGDQDGIADADDNCSTRPNADQRDTNLEGYGNRCDADFDNDGIVGGIDFGMFKVAFGSSLGQPAYNPDIDLDGGDLIGGVDFGIFNQLFSAPPGPSGLACAGTVPCP